MKKKFLAVVLSLCMPFSMTVSAQTAKNAADETAREVVIYHTNDTHGYLSGDGESIVGIDMAAGLKESTPNSILVDAGDATQGLPLASLTKGADIIRLMNMAGWPIFLSWQPTFTGTAVLFCRTYQKAILAAIR